MSPERVLILTGPTGVGKTDLSLELAALLNAEIISADSRIVYRGLDIGTAKPSAAERAAAQHHLLDVREPGERFTAADFRDACLAAIADIRARGRLPIIAGGTCMYLHALLHGFDFGGADRDAELREALKQRVEREGPEALHRELAAAAPEAAARIAPADARRIIRALELIEMTGSPMREIQKNNDENEVFPFPASVFILFTSREYLYDRINKRTDWMYNNGLIEETEGLFRQHDPGLRNFLDGIIGYKQAIEVIESRTDLPGAIETTKRETRRYAKRQMTWFRRMSPVVWVNVEERCKGGAAPLIKKYFSEKH